MGAFVSYTHSFISRPASALGNESYTTQYSGKWLMASFDLYYSGYLKIGNVENGAPMGVVWRRHTAVTFSERTQDCKIRTNSLKHKGHTSTTSFFIAYYLAIWLHFPLPWPLFLPHLITPRKPSTSISSWASIGYYDHTSSSGNSSLAAEGVPTKNIPISPILPPPRKKEKERKRV